MNRIIKNQFRQSKRICPGQNLQNHSHTFLSICMVCGRQSRPSATFAQSMKQVIEFSMTSIHRCKQFNHIFAQIRQMLFLTAAAVFIFVLFIHSIIRTRSFARCCCRWTEGTVKINPIDELASSTSYKKWHTGNDGYTLCSRQLLFHKKII